MKKVKYLIIITAVLSVVFWGRQSKEAGNQEAITAPVVEVAEREERSPEIFTTKTDPPALEPATSSSAAVLVDPPEAESAEIINLIVPFAPQAPFGKWSDPRQEDGCEEASSLLAVLWARGIKELSSVEAEKEILAIADYEEKEYGGYLDTSAADTLERIIKGYFGYQSAELKEVAAVGEIIEELIKGNLVIAPVDGQKLKNPFYTPPGPERHMLVIRGYDYGKKEFITNDVGTKRGEGYRYSEAIIDQAIRDYPSGHHEPIEEINRRIIVVKPQNNTAEN